jgi:hypothetical protein
MIKTLDRIERDDSLKANIEIVCILKPGCFAVFVQEQLQDELTKV